ncbi:hypothetical protein I6G56_08945 [Burkholderia humptydooensis]|uniref:Uncharacterized protein n=1 Tax=Burkholderia humptydooensis TaxID=430531 RepID=A0A7T2WZJ9_9BURK|nr:MULTISPECIES: hypothetical protein [Burkholderia]QPS45160.1 hypothetical protein I6G56_08945 [Burkholderia humptydooensis]
MKLLADVPDALRRAGIAVGNQDAGGVAVEQERLGALEDGRGIHEYSRAGEVARIEFRGIRFDGALAGYVRIRTRIFDMILIVVRSFRFRIYRKPSALTVGLSSRAIRIKRPAPSSPAAANP